MRRFYFDHNATTPLAPEVLETFTACLAEVYGNASSIHYFGQQAKHCLEDARRRLALTLGCDAREIVFTSGGTEAANLAILGSVRPDGRSRKHVVTSAIEHPAVLGACSQLEREGVEVTRVPVNQAGTADPDDVRRALRAGTVLVSIMHVNNETGVVQPVEEIARITREAGVLFHSDGVQAFGKLPLTAGTLEIDMYSISAHKIHAPKGIGALYVRRGMRLGAIVYGGRHERERRAGTENVPGVVAFAHAAELARSEDLGCVAAMRERLESSILHCIPAAGINGDQARRVPNTTNLYFEGIDAEALVIALDLRGFAVSTGAACSSGAIEPSHVLTAMGIAPERARASIRISLGRSNTPDEIDALAEALVDAVAHLRKISPIEYAHA